MHDSMQPVAKNGLQERFKDIFSNGRYNKYMILSHAEINLLIFKWRREGKKKHFTDQSLDSTTTRNYFENAPGDTNLFGYKGTCRRTGYGFLASLT